MTACLSHSSHSGLLAIVVLWTPAMVLLQDLCTCCSFHLRHAFSTYWTGLPFPSPGDLHDPGNLCLLASNALAGRFFTIEPPGTSLSFSVWCCLIKLFLSDSISAMSFLSILTCRACIPGGAVPVHLGGGPLWGVMAGSTGVPRVWAVSLILPKEGVRWVLPLAMVCTTAWMVAWRQVCGVCR